MISISLGGNTKYEIYPAFKSFLPGFHLIITKSDLSGEKDFINSQVSIYDTNYAKNLFIMDNCDISRLIQSDVILFLKQIKNMKVRLLINDSVGKDVLCANIVNGLTRAGLGISNGDLFYFLSKGRASVLTQKTLYEISAKYEKDAKSIINRDSIKNVNASLPLLIDRKIIPSKIQIIEEHDKNIFYSTLRNYGMDLESKICHIISGEDNEKSIIIKPYMTKEDLRSEIFNRFTKEGKKSISKSNKWNQYVLLPRRVIWKDQSKIKLPESIEKLDNSETIYAHIKHGETIRVKYSLEKRMGLNVN